MFTRSETAVTNILLNGIIMSTTNVTDLVKKMPIGRHYMGLNSLNYLLGIDETTQCVILLPSGRIKVSNVRVRRRRAVPHLVSPPSSHLPFYRRQQAG